MRVLLKRLLKTAFAENIAIEMGHAVVTGKGARDIAKRKGYGFEHIGLANTY